MTDLRTLLHESAPEPARPLEMADIRARASSRPTRRRLAAWIGALGVVLGAGLALGGPALRPADDSRIAVDMTPAPTVTTTTDQPALTSTETTAIPDRPIDGGIVATPATGARSSPPVSGASGSATTTTTSPSPPAFAPFSDTDYPTADSCQVDNRDLVPDGQRACRFKATKRSGASMRTEETSSASSAGVEGYVRVVREGKTTTYTVSKMYAEAGDLTVFAGCEFFIEPGDLVEVQIRNSPTASGVTTVGAGDGWAC